MPAWLAGNDAVRAVAGEAGGPGRDGVGDGRGVVLGRGGQRKEGGRQESDSSYGGKQEQRAVVTLVILSLHDESPRAGSFTVSARL